MLYVQKKKQLEISGGELLVLFNDTESKKQIVEKQLRDAKDEDAELRSNIDKITENLKKIR